MESPLSKLKPVAGVREAGHIFWPADDEDGREWRAGGPGPRPRDPGVPAGGVSPQYQLRSESYHHGHRASRHRQYGNHLLGTRLYKILNCTIYSLNSHIQFIFPFWIIRKKYNLKRSQLWVTVPLSWACPRCRCRCASWAGCCSSTPGPPCSTGCS